MFCVMTILEKYINICVFNLMMSNMNAPSWKAKQKLVSLNILAILFNNKK